MRAESGVKAREAVASTPLFAAFIETTDAGSATASSYTISAGDTFSGTIATAGDRDGLRIHLDAGNTYQFEMLGAASGFTLNDPYLRLYDSAGTLLEDADDGGARWDSQLTFTASASGDYYLDASAFQDGHTGSYQLSATQISSASTVSNDVLADYLINGFWVDWGETSRHFDTSGSNQITVDITTISSAAQQLARWAFQAWEAVANIDFVEVSSGAQITFDDSDAQGTAANTATVFSDGVTISANVLISDSWIYWEGAKIDSYGLQTYIHEIGHALGLGHLGLYNGSGTYPDDAGFLNDSWQVSIMSYFSQTDNTSTGASYAFDVTPMVADILAIQWVSGASTLLSGNTVYGAGTNLSGYMRTLMTAIASGSTSSSYGGEAVAMTISDSGGTDTIDLSFSASNQKLSLVAETFSDVDGLLGNLGIARGTVIEIGITGAGNDTLLGNAAANTLFGRGGNDSLLGGDAADTLVGDTGADTLLGEAGEDRIEGGDGADSVIAGEGADSIWGSLGGDTIKGEAGADFLAGEAGADLLYGGADADLLLGGSENDTLIGDAGADTLLGEGGDDRIEGGDGADSVIAGDGADSIWGSLANDTIWGNAGADFVAGEAGADLLYGGADADLLLGGSENDTLVGDLGNDTLYGETGNDRIEGGDGADSVIAGDGADSIWGSLANDTIWGNAGADFVAGEAGADLLYGGADADLLLGGSENDTLVGEAGNDTLYGETGNDRIEGGDGADSVSAGEGADSIWGSLANDTIWGNAGADFVAGEAGADLLYGGADADLLLGGSENDTLVGEAGNDTLYGETGNDRIEGGDGADSVSAGDGADSIWGSLANDTIWGNAGADFVAGEAGADLLYGGADADLLLGGSEADTIYGEAGNDTLYGEAGADSFIFTSSAGADYLADFSGAAGDRITLSQIAGVGSYAQVQAVASTVGGDCLLSFGAGNSLTLHGLSAAGLSADWFLFT